MPRVKRGTTHIKKRRKLLAKAKGFMWGRKNLIKAAKTAVVKAGVHAYVDRRKKKRVNRSLWQIKIGAFLKQNDYSYSKFMGALKNKQIELDRKIMADLAVNNEEVMIKLLEEVRK
jgi:large subunit ribosomal protein L20